MVFAREQIEIVTTMVDNVTGASKRVTKSIQEVGNGIYKTKEQVTGYDAKGKQLNRTTETVAHGQHRFKMELLGVMFAGMALYRVFGGLIRTQLELWGIMEGFGAMMTVVFLPIMEKLSDILWPIIDYFMDLPEGVQTAIGAFIILAAAIGLFLMLFGQIGLAVFSIAKAFPILAPIVKAVALAVTGSLGLILIIIAVIVAIVLGMYYAWKENFMGMKKVVKMFTDAIKGYFKALWKLLTSIFGFFIAIFKGDWDAAWEHIKNIFKAAKDMIVNSWKATIALMGMIIIGIIRVIKFVIDRIIGFFKWLYDKLVGRSIIPDIVNGIINWFKKLPSAILNCITGIPSKILNVFRGIGEQIYNMIVPKRVKGIISAAGKGFYAIKDFLGFQYGGRVPGPIGKPTLAMVHGGETIIPAGKTEETSNLFSPNITINATISSDYDVRRLAEELKRYWVTDFERVSQGRGI